MRKNKKPKNMKKLLTLFIFLMCMSCAPKKYMGYIMKETRDGTVVKRTKQFKNLSKCQRKSKRMARRRQRASTHNPNYGITTMTNAKQRH